MKRGLRLVVAMVIVATPATAQDTPQQTVENAQRFLALIPTQYTSEILPYRNSWPTAVKFRWESTSSPASCTTVLDGRITAYTRKQDDVWYEEGSRSFPQRATQVAAGLGLEGYLPYSIRWSRVSGITRPDYEINNTSNSSFETKGRIVKIDFSSSYIQIRFPNKAIADRVAYAMEFLKAACDKTAETGF